MRSPTGPYRALPSRAADRDTPALTVALASVALLLLAIASAGYFLGGLPIGMATLCALVPVGIVALIIVLASLIGARRRTRLWLVLAEQDCPSCSATLGLASLHAGVSDRIAVVPGVGLLTFARCSSCGQSSEWTAQGTLHRTLELLSSEVMHLSNDGKSQALGVPS